MREGVRIVALCTTAAVAYGIVHDQITARVCVEYFTIGHPPVGTDSPTLLGLVWGIIATWWVGLLLGILLAISAQVGARPKLQANILFKPLLIVLLCSAVVAMLAGITGFVLAQTGNVWLLEPLASLVPPEKHVAFLADLWAHSASYLAGFVGGLILAVWTYIHRGRLQNHNLNSDLGMT